MNDYNEDHIKEVDPAEVLTGLGFPKEPAVKAGVLTEANADPWPLMLLSRPRQRLSSPKRN